METLLEYYFIVTLSNHVVIELPVAQTAFLPRPVEVPAEVDLWPKTVRPESPRIKYPEDDFRSTTPSCVSGRNTLDVCHSVADTFRTTVAWPSSKSPLTRFRLDRLCKVSMAAGPF